MSERKVLNKYYPRDYDPSNIPRAKRPRNRQWTIRTMAPFNMRCNTCGEYIYKGKKFNSRQEMAEGETYLTLKIFRFYIKCPKCISEITFKTDPQSMDYVLEAGATRNFEALRTAELMAVKEAAEKEAELENNPMKMLENRTKASQREMDIMETLQDIRDLNKKHAGVDMNELIEEKVRQQKLFEEKLKQVQDEEDEKFVQSVFGAKSEYTVTRLSDSEDSDSEESSAAKYRRLHKPAASSTKISDEEESGSSTSGASSMPSTSASTSGCASTEAATSSSTNHVAASQSSQQSKEQFKKNVLKNSVSVTKPKKNSLGMLVKKKDPSSKETVVNAPKVSLYEQVKRREAEMEAQAKVKVKQEVTSEASVKVECTAAPPGGLSLLGGYSDSDDSSASDS